MPQDTELLSEEHSKILSDFVNELGIDLYNDVEVSNTDSSQTVIDLLTRRYAQYLNTAHTAIQGKLYSTDDFVLLQDPVPYYVRVEIIPTSLQIDCHSRGKLEVGSRLLNKELETCHIGINQQAIRQVWTLTPKRIKLLGQLFLRLDDTLESYPLQIRNVKQEGYRFKLPKTELPFIGEDMYCIFPMGEDLHIEELLVYARSLRKYGMGNMFKSYFLKDAHAPMNKFYASVRHAHISELVMYTKLLLSKCVFLSLLPGKEEPTIYHQ